MSDAQFRPRLRPHFSVAPGASADSGMVTIHDLLRISQPIQVSPAVIELMKLFDGQRTVDDIRSAFAQRQGGQLVELPVILQLVQYLEQAMILDGPTLRAKLDAPIREPSCIGTYPEEPEAIRQQLQHLFTAPSGPGLPAVAGSRANEGRRLRAVLVPHMDYRRGNITYGWGFRELFERTTARLFVIIATSHYSGAPFTLSKQHFRTPLGVAETDQNFVNKLEAHYGPGLYDDREAHVPEHSIELEVLLLQYLYETVGAIRIVPLLVSSYARHVNGGTDPATAANITRMAEGLRLAEAAAGEPVCYIISGDLAHIGPKFDDPEPVNANQLAYSRAQDHKLLDKLTTADAAGYFQVIANEGDDRRICGLPPTHLTLLAACPTRGKILHYQQYIHPHGHESVSFASASFDS